MVYLCAKSSKHQVRRLLLLHVHWIAVVWIGVLIHCIAVALDGFGLFECVGSHRLVEARVLPVSNGHSSGMNRFMISSGEHSLHDMHPMRFLMVGAVRARQRLSQIGHRGVKLSDRLLQIVPLGQTKDDYLASGFWLHTIFREAELSNNV